MSTWHVTSWPASDNILAFCISTVGLLWYIMYPIITVNVVRILTTCHELCTGPSSCTSWMRSDYSIRCDDVRHRDYTAGAAAVFALVAIVSPLLLGYLLITQRSALLAKIPGRLPTGFSLGMTFFYKPFKDQLLYWEVVELFESLQSHRLLSSCSRARSFSCWL